MTFKKRNNNQTLNDPTSGKVYGFFEWIWRIFVINLLTMITCMGVFTIVPSFVASFRTMNDLDEGETHIIRKYFKNFLFCFEDTVGLSIVLLVITVLFAYAYIFYSEAIGEAISQGYFNFFKDAYSVLLGFTIIFGLVVMIAMIHIPGVVTYFHFRFIDKIRFTFYFAYRYLGLSVFMLLVVAADVFVSIRWPYLVFVFTLSLPNFLLYKLTKRKYSILVDKMELDEYEEDEYDMNNKVQNKETYEDEDKDAINEKAVEELKKINDEITRGIK